MAVFRVEKNKNYTVMSNTHLRDRALSLKAKGLLSLILSLPDNWHYSVKGLAAISKEGRSGIMSALKELEQTGYLIRHQLRDEHGLMGQIEYVIYEEPKPPQSQNPTTVNPPTEDPNSEKPYSGEPTTGFRTQSSKKEQIQERQITTSTNNRFDSILSTEDNKVEEMRNERDTYRALISENIEYEFLSLDKSINRDDLEELFEIILETICSKKPFIRICGEEKPTEVVRSRLLKLNSDHIRFVLDCMSENTSKIRNIKQYLLAALYNAPVTISNYYGALVNHDMNN